MKDKILNELNEIIVNKQEQQGKLQEAFGLLETINKQKQEVETAVSDLQLKIAQIEKHENELKLVLVYLGKAEKEVIADES